MNQIKPTVLSEVLAFEIDTTYSRESVVLASGNTAELGTVLAKLANGKYTPVNPAGTGAEKKAVAVAIEKIDATDADKNIAIVARGAVVSADNLLWVDTITSAQKASGEAELTSATIVVRASL